MSLFTFVFGAVIGSFLNVVIFRVPAGKSIVKPPSHCSGCNNRLRSIDLIPILSYLFLRGRCRHCGVRISARYPFVEFLTGILFMTAYYFFGLSWNLFFALGYISLMVAIALIDYDHQIIPDGLILFGFSIAIAEKVVQSLILGMKLSIGNDLIGLLVGGGVFLLIAVISRGGMGGGDIKLMGLLGFVFGYPSILMIMALAFVLGAMISILLLTAKLKTRKDPIPFGPFIVLSAVIVMLGQNQIISWYVHYFLM